jgi:hypothetical protein
MAVQIQLRNDTAANWTAANPILAIGEMGIETDTDKFKLGNGSTAWESLPYGGVQGPQGPAGIDGADGTFSSAQTVETKSANYTLTSEDAGKLIINSAAITITVQGLSVGQQVDFIQNVAGQITFVGGSGITLNSPNGLTKTAAQYSPAGLKCVSANTYVLVGDLGI